jgi:hypothetical protein
MEAFQAKAGLLGICGNPSHVKSITPSDPHSGPGARPNLDREEILGPVWPEKQRRRLKNSVLVISADPMRYPSAVLDGLTIKQKEKHGNVDRPPGFAMRFASRTKSTFIKSGGVNERFDRAGRPCADRATTALVVGQSISDAIHGQDQ